MASNNNVPRRNKRLTSAEIRAICEELDSEEEEHVTSDNNEESDAELECEVDQELSSDSDMEVESTDQSEIRGTELKAKDGTIWRTQAFRQHQSVSRNILREKAGPTNRSTIQTIKEVFKSFITPEMIDIIIRCSNRKAHSVIQSIEDFTEVEIDAFLGILIAAGVHKSNKENIEELWKSDALPIYKASMSRNRFKEILRFIRFDDQNTRAERAQTDKAAPIRDIWNMLNRNLFTGYKPGECITVDEQLYPFRCHTKFTQYIPSKPAKYGIKVFWACDSSSSYPLQGILYTGKPIGGERQTNIGQKTVLDLVNKYKGSGRNITTDNFFTGLELSNTLKSWKMTLVGTLRKNKPYLPSNMKISKSRPVFSTNFAYRKDTTICSYMAKQNKAVIMLSSMHLTGNVDCTDVSKPEIINYYNKTKGGVDNMDKMVSEYSVQRATKRWPLAFFYNIINVAALATYIVVKESKNHQKNQTSQRRILLKELALELCTPAIEIRSLNKNIVKYPAIRSAIESCLDTVGTVSTPSTMDRGVSPVVGSCYLCTKNQMKRRKTSSCVSCNKPVCAEHSTKSTCCNECQ